MEKNKCKDVLEGLHKAIKCVEERVKEIDEEYDVAIALQEQVIKIQKNVEEKKRELEKYMKCLAEWLEEYGDHLGCNITDPKCQEILSKMIELGLDLDDIQKEALEESEEVYSLMKEVSKGEVLLKELYVKYVECIHKKDHCGC